MLKIILDKDTIFEYKEEENKIFLNNSPFSWDKSQVSSNFYHIIKDSKSYSAEVISFDKETKTFVFKINQQMVQCSIRDQFDELLDQMGIQQNNSGKLKELKAPMPGLIAQVMVAEGQSVEQGDALVILEAMKMENLIKATGAGVVKSVRVQKGDSVEKNQLLIQFE